MSLYANHVKDVVARHIVIAEGIYLGDEASDTHGGSSTIVQLQ